MAWEGHVAYRCGSEDGAKSLFYYFYMYFVLIVRGLGTAI